MYDVKGNIDAETITSLHKW